MTQHNYHIHTNPQYMYDNSARDSNNTNYRNNTNYGNNTNYRNNIHSNNNNNNTPSTPSNNPTESVHIPSNNIQSNSINPLILAEIDRQLFHLTLREKQLMRNITDRLIKGTRTSTGKSPLRIKTQSQSHKITSAIQQILREIGYIETHNKFEFLANDYSLVTYVFNRLGVLLYNSEDDVFNDEREGIPSAFNTNSSAPHYGHKNLSGHSSNAAHGNLNTALRGMIKNGDSFLIKINNQIYECKSTNHTFDNSLCSYTISFCDPSVMILRVTCKGQTETLSLSGLIHNNCIRIKSKAYKNNGHNTNNSKSNEY